MKKILTHYRIMSVVALLFLVIASMGIERVGTAIQDKSDECSLDCCVGLVATGKICKEQRSILWKNRHMSVNNQKPYFYQGDRYAFFGVGGASGQCRMGMNEKGLAVGNFDVPGALDHWEYCSDGSSGSEDNDMKIPLGNFSTVVETAWWLAHHAYHGQGRQWGIISAEQGVGAVVAMDTTGHSNITWVNNSYVVVANAFYCDGDTDPDGTDTRAAQLVETLLFDNTSSSKIHGIEWQDICQIVAKDTNDKEKGTGTFNYGGEISGASCLSAMVAVSGNPHVHLAWLNIGKTTQIGIFLPLSASYLKSPTDIPLAFREGNGIQPYVDVKFNYASAGTNEYYCERVRDIQQYAFANENLTFQWFARLESHAQLCSNKAEVQSLMKRYVEAAVRVALDGYIHNSTTRFIQKLYGGSPLLVNRLFQVFLPSKFQFFSPSSYHLSDVIFHIALQSS